MASLEDVFLDLTDDDDTVASRALALLGRGHEDREETLDCEGNL